jgi:hypothetical protein
MTAERTTHSPGSTDRYKPPKTIEQLEREQGLSGKPFPDFIELAFRVWRTKQDVREFERHIRSIRRGSKD